MLYIYIFFPMEGKDSPCLPVLHADTSEGIPLVSLTV